MNNGTTTTTAKTFLHELRREIESHPAVNHIFLQRLATSPFAKQDYRVFAENHYPLVCVFTSYLEQLLVRAPSSEDKLWLAKVLVDEYGEGSDGKDHATLYARFLGATGGSHVPQHEALVPGPALRFIREHQRIVREEPFLVGLGAVGPGHEWAIPKMFDCVIPGLRRAGFTEDAIGYFVLHVAQDEDHGAWLENALAAHCGTSADRARIRRGALLSLDARDRFWTGVQRAIVRWRQPRALRPDGASPRSTAAEILLTAWDGWAFARTMEEMARATSARFRPRLSSLLARS